MQNSYNQNVSKPIDISCNVNKMNIVMNNKKYYLFIIMLAMMGMVGMMSSDIYLPALPQMSLFFQTTPQYIQATLSVYLLGLATAQVIYGSLSDRFGRKSTILYGMIIYIVFSILCTTCNNITNLIIYRFFQAIGACSGMVILRVIINDLFQKKEAIKVFTTVFPIIALSPAIAPIIGGLLTSFFGWRANFLFLTLVGILVLLMIIVLLKETLPQENKTSISVSNLIRNYSKIIKNPLYIAYSIMVSSASGAYFIYLTCSPFIFYKLGFEAYYIGFFYIIIGTSYIFGNLLSKKLIRHIATTKILSLGVIFFVIGGITMFILSWSGINSPFELIIPMSILTLGNGFLLPIGISSAIRLFPHMAGTASGLMGFFQFGIISMLTIMLNYFLGDSAFFMSLTIFIITIICALSMTLVLKHSTIMD